MVETVMMTLTEIAARDGVSRQALSKTVRGLIKKTPDIPVERDRRGRISRVSVAHLDHYRGRYQNPAKVMAARRPGKGEPVTSETPMDPPAADPGGRERAGDSYDEARRRNEWIRYERQKLDRDEHAGKLIRADSLALAIELIGREMQAIVTRIQNRADDVAMAGAKEGVHGVRVMLREIGVAVNTAQADKLAEIAELAPAVEAVDLGDDTAEFVN